jgi:hypothetical protein
MQASTTPPPVSSTLYHARLAPKRTDNPGEARASRDRLSVGDVALWSLLSRLERERHELQSVCTRESARGAKRRGRGDEMCSAWSRSTVDHDKACCRFEDLRRLEAVPLLRCSHGGKRLGARPARPLRPLHRVDDEEGRRRPPSGERFYALRCKWPPAAPSLYYLPLPRGSEFNGHRPPCWLVDFGLPDLVS